MSKYIPRIIKIVLAILLFSTLCADQPRKIITTDQPEEIIAKQQDLATAVREYLTSNQWDFGEMQDGGMFYVFIQGENDRWPGLIRTIEKEEEKEFIFYSILGETSRKYRHEVAEYLTRANHNLHIGNFEMDFSDGNVRYKTSVDITGGTLTQAMINTMVERNIIISNRYLPGLRKVSSGKATPMQAIMEIEKDYQMQKLLQEGNREEA